MSISIEKAYKIEFIINFPIFDYSCVLISYLIGDSWPSPYSCDYTSLFLLGSSGLDNWEMEKPFNEKYIYFASKANFLLPLVSFSLKYVSHEAASGQAYLQGQF